MWACSVATSAETVSLDTSAPAGATAPSTSAGTPEGDFFRRRRRRFFRSPASPEPAVGASDSPTVPSSADAVASSGSSAVDSDSSAEVADSRSACNDGVASSCSEWPEPASAETDAALGSGDEIRIEGKRRDLGRRFRGAHDGEARQPSAKRAFFLILR